MLWTPQQRFHDWPFDKEADLEAAIAQVKTTLFGESRVYLDVKKAHWGDGQDTEYS